MKLYKTIRREKITSVTHSSNGAKYKRPKKKTEFVDQNIECDDAASFISDALTRGHIEENLELMANFISAMALGDKDSMARLIFPLRGDYCVSKGELHAVIGCEFKD